MATHSNYLHHLGELEFLGRRYYIEKIEQYQFTAEVTKQEIHLVDMLTMELKVMHYEVRPEDPRPKQTPGRADNPNRRQTKVNADRSLSEMKRKDNEIIRKKGRRT